MKIRFRPGIADSRGAREALDNAARRQGLRLQFESEREASAVVSVLR